MLRSAKAAVLGGEYELEVAGRRVAAEVAWVSECSAAARSYDDWFACELVSSGPPASYSAIAPSALAVSRDAQNSAMPSSTGQPVSLSLQLSHNNT